jgi:hypothetical protein
LKDDITGSRGFKGTMGQAKNEDIQNKRVERFKPVAGEVVFFTGISCSGLSCDPKYLYKISLVITSWPKIVPRELEPY